MSQAVREYLSRQYAERAKSEPMKRVLLVGHWLEESERVFPYIYDISTPELARKYAIPLYEMYLERFHKGGTDLPAREYTVEVHKKKWKYDHTDANYAKHFERETKEQQEKANKFYAAYDAYKDGGDVEEVIKYLNTLDDVDLVIDVQKINEEFVLPPKHPGSSWDDEEDDE